MAAPSQGYNDFIHSLPNEDARLRDRVWDRLFPAGTVSLRNPVQFEYRVSCHPL